MRRYIEEERQFFINFVPGHSHKEITEEFNRRFDEHISVNQVKAYIHNHNLNTGRTGCYEKGNIPFNKGKHFNAGGRSVETRFKKGNIPHNHRPVGSERFTRDGYIEIKVAEPNKWKLKHRVVYENAYGPLNKGEVIIFKDQNKLNVNLENLMVVSRNILARMNQNNLFGESSELTEAGVEVAKLIVEINSRRKKK